MFSFFFFFLCVRAAALSFSRAAAGNAWFSCSRRCFVTRMFLMYVSLYYVFAPRSGSCRGGGGSCCALCTTWLSFRHTLLVIHDSFSAVPLPSGPVPSRLTPFVCVRCALSRNFCYPLYLSRALRHLRFYPLFRRQRIVWERARICACFAPSLSLRSLCICLLRTVGCVFSVRYSPPL